MVYDEKYYTNNIPLVKVLNINIERLHNLITGLWKLFILELKFDIAKKYYQIQINLNHHTNCQITIRDILLLVTNKKIYPPIGTHLLGYDNYTTVRDLV